MMDDLRNGRARGVVVADFDRFLRPDRLGKIGILDVFQDTDSILYFQGGEIDLATDSGFMNAALQSLVAGTRDTHVQAEGAWC